MDKNVETIIKLLKYYKDSMDDEMYKGIMADIAVCTYDTEGFTEEQMENIPYSDEWENYAKNVYELADIEVGE